MDIELYEKLKVKLKTAPEELPGKELPGKELYGFAGKSLARRPEN